MDPWSESEEEESSPEEEAPLDDNKEEAEAEADMEGDGSVPNRMIEKPRFLQNQIFGANRRAMSHLWLVSYSDFMTILMIFFLAMYGYMYLAKLSALKAHGKEISYSDFSKMMIRLKGELNNQIQILEDVKKVVIQLPDRILFPSGEAKLTKEAQRTLEELAESIKLVAGDVVVEGHTDNVPIAGGRYRSNWELSAARAFSVIEAFTKKGVAPTRLSAWGFGENRPRAPNDSARNRAANRRIEIVLLKKTKSA